AEMQRPRVGAVVSPLVGDEEQTFGAAVENLQLNAFMGTTGYACWLVTRIVTLAGKSVLIRRATIDAFGGWDELGRYAGEDVMLFTRVKELGLKVVLGRHAVRNVAQRITLARCAARHMRWAQIRWRTVTPTTILEPLLSPLLIGVVFALLAPGQTSFTMLAGGFVLQTLGDLVALRAQRGHTLSLAYLPAIWLRPFLGIWVWARGLVSARFEWRGHAFWMGPSSTILMEPPMRARLRAMRERSA
ncbi:MAG: glycosyltransferase, partial [Deltaproteobacteria bacterium]